MRPGMVCSMNLDLHAPTPWRAQLSARASSCFYKQQPVIQQAELQVFY
jgi:hypothetical protein